LLHLRGDLAGLRKAADGLLRVDQLAVEGDLEDPVTALDQDRLEVELLRDLCRQTGGSGLVVSNHAIFDLHAGHDASFELAVK